VSLAERRQRNGAAVIPIRPGMREPYKLAPEFMRAVAALAAGHAGRAFFLAIGHAIEPDLLPDARAKTVLELVRALRAESGNPPACVTTTVQRLVRHLDDGKVTFEHFEACVAYITEYDDADVPGVDEAVAAIRPTVTRKIIETKAAPDMLAAIGTGDVRAARKAIDLVDQIQKGRAAAAVGDDWDEADAKAAVMGALPRFETGLPIDAHVDGGIKRGLVTDVIAGTGVGKSPTLVHFGAEAIFRGLFVVHVTLQDPEWVVFNRYKANLLDAPVAEVERDPKRATRLLRELHPQLGRLRVRQLQTDVATPQDCFDAIDAEEQRAGKSIDVFVCDYPGRLAAGGKLDVNGRSHTGIAAVAARFEMYAWGALDGLGHKGGPVWTFVAQQERRRSRGDGLTTVDRAKSKPVTTDDGADGMGTARDAGFVLTLQRAQDGTDEESAVLVAHVAKNKLGPWGSSVELVPNLAHCRIQASLPHRAKKGA
jgi:hypothetical protein